MEVTPKKEKQRSLLITTGLYPPEVGGPATYTKLLEEQLPKYGVMITVLPFSRSRHFPKGIRHLHYLIATLRNAWHADCVYAQDTLSVGLPSALAARILRKPFLLRVPGDYVWEQAVQRFGVTDDIDTFQSKKYNIRVACMRKLQRFVAKSATRVVTPSDYFNQLVKGWGVDEGKVVTIYNGIKLVKQKDEMSRLKVPARPFMVSVGRLVPWKGFKMLITLLKSLSEWSLVIIGDGPERKELEKHAHECGVSERVKFLGARTREEVRTWCRDADAFVLNTSFESFSYQVVEAMDAGAAIITTSIGSLPELLQNEKEGLLLTPGDHDAFRMALLSMQEHHTLWQARRKAAQEKAGNFSIEKTLEGIYALLSTVLSTNKTKI